MPKNKNAVIRYLFLDRLLSDQKHKYTCLDLAIKCNEMLIQAGYPGICEGNARCKEEVTSDDSMLYQSAKRLILMDIQALQDTPFSLEIDSSEKVYGAPVYRYKDPTCTLFSKQLSDDEKRLLSEVFHTLGQFSGIDSFSWLQELKERLESKQSFGRTFIGDNNTGIDDERPIISFEENKYLKNKDYLPLIFSYIAKKQTIKFSYQKFFAEKPKEFIVYPYLLKQYNNRWFLLCTPVNGRDGVYNPELILTLPLDRIVGAVMPEDMWDYKECAVDLQERFEEIIGITFYDENPVEEIIIAIQESVVPLIETKPLHESQRLCLDPAFHIDGYKTFCIECRYNYELLSTIYSYGDEMIVLSPTHLIEKISHRLSEQLRLYKLVKKLYSRK